MPTYAEELADFLRCGVLVFISLRSFADESYGHDVETTPWYVISGYVGKPNQWSVFERIWRKTIRDEGIRDIGFHANRCVRGRGEYQEVEHDRRERIQHGLIKAIVKSEVRGVLASIDMNLYRANRDRLNESFSNPDLRKFNNPYLLAFHQFVQLTTKAEKSSLKIGFMFDRRPKGALGSSPEWYDSLRDQPGTKFRNRMGPFAWDTRGDAIEMDAADMLAYCSYRHLSGDSMWQWDALNNGYPIITYQFDRKYWDDLFAAIARENHLKMELH